MKYPLGLRLPTLLTFLSLTCAITAELSNTGNCELQAWVRAPDLEPGEIIPGQVKVLTRGPCDHISEYSLILRFKERIWVKIPKPGVVFPKKPRLTPNPVYDDLDNDGASIEEWMINRNSVLKVDPDPGFGLFGFPRDPSWKKYVKIMKDSTLWEIIEEERVAFETRYKLSDDLIPQSTVHDFALLVPTTNYPPSIDQTVIPFNEESQAESGHEHIYLYTVEVKFDNGTTIELPAGYTSFIPVGSNSNLAKDPDNDTSETVSIAANFTQMSLTNSGNFEVTPLNISSDIEVEIPHHCQLEQGSVLSLTFTSNGKLKGVPDADQENHTLILTSPSVIIHVVSQHRRIETLLPELSVPAEIRPTTLLRCHHFPTSDDAEYSALCGNQPTFSQIQLPDWKRTTSVPLEVPKIALPSFDMYYQSFEARILVTLSLKYVQTGDPIKLASDDNDQIYPWIPARPLQNQDIQKYFQTLMAEIPVTIHSRTRKPDFEATHYLSPDARQPVFVDPCTADELSRLPVEKRDVMALLSKPVIKRNTGEPVVRTRYYHDRLFLHYVGNTWQRKVRDDGVKVNLSENSRCRSNISTHDQALWSSSNVHMSWHQAQDRQEL